MKTQKQPKMTTVLKFSTDENTLFLTVHDKVICKFQFNESGDFVDCSKCAFHSICKSTEYIKCHKSTRQDETNGYWKTIE